MAKLSYSMIASLDDGVRVELELLDERRFGNGMVHLGYRTTRLEAGIEGNDQRG